MTQKLTIPALDHGQAIADEILDGVSQSGGFPGLVGETTHAEEGFGNLTVAGAVVRPSTACSIWRARRNCCSVNRASCGTARP